MTQETERRIRSLAANKVDLELRVNLMRSANIANVPHDKRQEMAGDLAVAQRALHEVEVELLDLTMSTREV